VDPAVAQSYNAVLDRSETLAALLAGIEKLEIEN